MTGLKKLLMWKAASGGGTAPQTETLSGSLVTFETSKVRALKECLVSFDSEQTGLNIFHIGKNWFNVSANTYKDDYFLNDQGNEQPSSSGSGYTTSYTAVIPGTTYTFSGTIGDSSTGWRLYYYNHDKGWIKRSAWIGPSNSYTFTTPSNCYYIGFQYSKNVVDFSTFQLEIGETATAYESYTGSENSVSWTESATQGVYDAKTGILTILTPTPGTVQLDPVQIATFSGVNNIWSDAGEITVTYTV